MHACYLGIRDLGCVLQGLFGPPPLPQGPEICLRLHTLVNGVCKTLEMVHYKYWIGPLILHVRCINRAGYQGLC